jgi:hypothetical protein
MDKILEHVLDENKEWVKSLTPENIAYVLNTCALIPQMKTKFNVDRESDIAAIKGITGESKFDNIVSQFMSSDYELINVAKQGKSGDFLIKWQSQKTNRIYKILVDVKNYSKSTVPTIEVEKFYRDINLNTVDGGFLLSLNSRIIGINKIIELKDCTTDKAIIPVIFMKSNTPLVIVEVIKLMFHIIEIKDLNNNNICRSGELIYHINQLNDSIQMISDCRDILQISKIDLEKNLNAIMIKLMSCEYSLVSKINLINSALVKLQTLEHSISDNDIKELDDYQNNMAESLDMVKTIRDAFGSLISDEIESLLYKIYNLGWSNTSINIPNKTWILNLNTNQVIIKFMKSGISVIFPVIMDTMRETISTLTAAKKIKKSADGIVIKIEIDTIIHIAALYECFKF